MTTAVRGFTLLELLVVLFIIGITLGFATLTISGDDGADRLEREAERLEALMEMASEEAVLFGVEIGLDLTQEGYRFLRLDRDGWRPVEGSTTPLRPRELPEGMELRLLQSEDEDNERARPLAPRGRPSGDDDEEDDADERSGPRPQVLFLSSGELTPFELQLQAEDVAPRYLYEGNRGGELAMRRELPAGS